MANFTQEIFWSARWFLKASIARVTPTSEPINGMERIMGARDNPVRNVLNYRGALFA